MKTRDEVVAAVVERYARASRLERGRILDEFVGLTGHHRKHAMRLLRAGKGGRGEQRLRQRAQPMQQRVCQAEAATRVGSKMVRQWAFGPGAFSGEAIRDPIQIVALHLHHPAETTIDSMSVTDAPDGLVFVGP